MPIPIRTRLPTQNSEYVIEITDDGSLTVVRRDDDVAYHSGCGAAAECDHVYVLNGGIDSSADDWPSAILEVGLGTGMAMLRTLDKAIVAERPLTYVAIESTPLAASVLQDLNLAAGLTHPELVDQFLAWWDRATKSDGQSAIWNVDELRSVTVCFEDLLEWLPNQSNSEASFDTIYFDPFDPHVSPELWQLSVFQKLFERLRPGGRLVTYCVKSEIRRRLTEAGFDAQCVPGPVGGKREVMLAKKPMIDRQP